MAVVLQVGAALTEYGQDVLIKVTDLSAKQTPKASQQQLRSTLATSESSDSPVRGDSCAPVTPANTSGPHPTLHGPAYPITINGGDLHVNRLREWLADPVRALWLIIVCMTALLLWW